MPKEDIRFQERDEIQGLINRPPGWILSYGNGALLATVLLVLVLAAVIRYPDVMEAPAYLSSEQPAVAVTAPSGGILQQLLVQDGEEVEKEAPLAVIGGRAHWQAVRRLEALLQQTGLAAGPSFPPDTPFPPIEGLGSLQAPYNQLRLRLQQLSFFREQQSARARIQHLEEQLAKIRELNESLQIQIDTLEREVAIARNNYRQYEQLFQRGSASELEVETSQTAYLRYQRQLQAQRDELLDNQLAMNRLETQVLMLRQEEALEEQNHLAALTESANELQHAMEGWKARRLASAPIAGKVVFTAPLAEGQYLNAEQELAQLLPAGEAPVLAIAQLAAPGIGKVQKGQEARVRLDAYPYREYGQLRGRVEHIASVPRAGANQYLLTISLPDGLRTSFGQDIPFQQRLSGQAYIITADRSFLGRLFGRLRAVFIQ